jgi:hypothetical protein
MKEMPVLIENPEEIEPAPAVITALPPKIGFRRGHRKGQKVLEKPEGTGIS